MDWGSVFCPDHPYEALFQVFDIGFQTILNYLINLFKEKLNAKDQ